MKSSISFDQIIEALEKATFHAVKPMSVTLAKQFNRDPFIILISCLLSLRTRDSVTLPVSLHLFSHIQTPQQLLDFPIDQLQSIIRSINYYQRKTQILRSVSHEIINRFQGCVPNNLDDLLSIKGVGLKTANLVLAEAFEIPAICVDTHVHRISNQLGIVATQTPEQTEKALKAVVPQKYWITWSRLLVMLGQSKKDNRLATCSACSIRKLLL